MGLKGSKSSGSNNKAKKLCAKDALNLDLFFMSRPEADAILGDAPQKCGTFLIYEDANTRRTFLAFKASHNGVEHHPITYRGELYYLGNYPFPYLESIVLYYRKHKLDSTKLTHQAFIEPYLMASRKIGRSPTPVRNNSASSAGTESPEVPRTKSFIAKYGVYRRQTRDSEGLTSCETSRESEII